MTMYKMTEYHKSTRYADDKRLAGNAQLSVTKVDPKDVAITAPGLMFNKV